MVWLPEIRDVISAKNHWLSQRVLPKQPQLLLPVLPEVFIAAISNAPGVGAELGGPLPAYRLEIENATHVRVGIILLSVSPLIDCVYLWSIEIAPQNRHYGTATLKLLVDYLGLPIIPVKESSNARAFWSSVHLRACQAFPVFEPVSFGDYVNERARWAHLIPATVDHLCQIARQEEGGPKCRACEIRSSVLQQPPWCFDRSDP